MTTGQRILDALQAQGKNLKSKGAYEYRGFSPLRPDSDGENFVLHIAPDGEHGGWYDHKEQKGGSLYELAKLMGIETPKGDGPTNETPLTAYDSLEEYATAHGISPQVLRAAGWEYVIHTANGKTRPALRYPTAGGHRLRFIDGAKPKYKPEKVGYKDCWYGLKSVVKLKEAGNWPAAIICNGEPSVIVAQHFGVPAFAKTGGEAKLPDKLLDELKAVYSGPLWIAMDCDDKGRQVSKAIQAQWPDSVILDMALGDKGDLADYCKLQGDAASIKAGLIKLADKAQRPNETPSDVVMRRLIDRLTEPVIQRGVLWKFPYPSFHPYGGFAQIVKPGKIIGVLGVSGGGKTSFLETGMDILLQQNLDILWFGPEWSEDELAIRRVTRYGGLTMNDEAMDMLWHMETADGIPEPLRQGKALSLEQIQKSAAIAAQLARWPGKCYAFESKPDDRIVSVQDLLGRMANTIEKLRRKGRRVATAVIDYAQLLGVDKPDATINRYEQVVEEVKYFVQSYEFSAIVASQVTKTSSKDQKKQGDSLKSDDALYLRDDKFNLYFSLNRDYEYPDDGDPIPLNTGHAYITKNSTGQSGVKIPMRLELHRHRWIDKSHIVKD